eukprot:SAG31_NODE_1020_length_10349_cov_5.621561_2_plen_95_part_00
MTSWRRWPGGRVPGIAFERRRGRANVPGGRLVFSTVEARENSHCFDDAAVDDPAVAPVAVAAAFPALRAIPRFKRRVVHARESNRLWYRTHLGI